MEHETNINTHILPLLDSTSRALSKLVGPEQIDSTDESIEEAHSKFVPLILGYSQLCIHIYVAILIWTRALLYIMHLAKSKE